jgi:hypothetical protein
MSRSTQQQQHQLHSQPFGVGLVVGSGSYSRLRREVGSRDSGRTTTSCVHGHDARNERSLRQAPAIAQTIYFRLRREVGSSDSGRTATSCVCAKGHDACNERALRQAPAIAQTKTGSGGGGRSGRGCCCRCWCCEHHHLLRCACQSYCRCCRRQCSR